MNVAIVGYGKMGHEIEKILLERGHSVSLIIDMNNSSDLDATHLKGIDVAIEFTTPLTAFDNVCTLLRNKVRVVSGTTGWNDRLQIARSLCEQNGTAFMYSSNYSLGVNILFNINRKLAELMNRFPSYEISMKEIHHTQKKDAPSGTAITLAEDIIERVERKKGWVNATSTDNQELIPIESERIGTTPGTHSITYSSEDDTLEVIHTLHSRRALALGAVIAAEYISTRTGNFTIDNLFE